MKCEMRDNPDDAKSSDEEIVSISHRLPISPRSVGDDFDQHFRCETNIEHYTTHREKVRVWFFFVPLSIQKEKKIASKTVQAAKLYCFLSKSKSSIF